ncbi:MAG TPA: uroporphyrinogen decarboxylase family protein [Anaerolineales bacterium]|nr:uroporphyrinogen decarboxylase family protein [Anaerolineales bacterium]
MNNLERFKKAINWEPIDRLLTYDFLDNRHLLVEHGSFDETRDYSFDELIEVNAKAWKSVGVDITRFVYDPVNHWMGSKITNWIRFFGVNPDNWEVSQTGGTAWISKRPFKTLTELEKHLPQLPVYEEVRDWYQPSMRQIQAGLREHDIVMIGAIEGPITDAYSYMDMELFMQAMFDAPELVSHIMDCTGMFSAHIAKAFAEISDVPLLFMGEDIACTTGPIFNPKFVRKEGLPRWRWITEPVKRQGFKFLFHTDGRYGNFLPLIFDELGADGLNPIERNGCNDIFEIRDKYPNKLLFGNVCCIHTLPHGTLGDVEDETLELIEKIGPQGGIFIGSSSEVHDAVPVENAAKMYHTVHEYGSYPIAIDRIRARRAELRKKNELKLRRQPAL